MKSTDFLLETIVDDAANMHQDHEVQMARQECYHAAEHAIAIHKLLRSVSENNGIEGWVSSKITLANDYLNSVREYLEYELMQQDVDPGLSTDIEPIAENINQHKKKHKIKESATGDTPVDQMTDKELADYLGGTVTATWVANHRQEAEEAAHEKSKKMVAEETDDDAYHTRLGKGKFLPSVYGDEDNLYLHDLMNSSGDGSGPMLVTIKDRRVATELAAMYGGNVEKTAWGTYRVFQPRGQTQTTKNPELVDVAEAGPFSYGARKPRKGSVAANAEQKRREQERGKQPIEPRDQRVGTAKVTKGVAEGLNEMDKSAPQPGRDGKVSHSTYGSRDKKGSDYFKGKEAPGKPITKKQMEKDTLDILKKQGVAEGTKCNHTMEGAKCPVHGLRECPIVESLSDEQRTEHERQLSDFVRGGGQVERLRAQKGPRRSGASLGSRHIGGRSDAQTGKRSQTRGLGSSPTGKLLVAKENRTANSKQQPRLMQEMNAGSVATVVNPKTSKPKSQVGTLFGGTYKQTKKKVKESNKSAFAGEKTSPPQVPGDQVKGTEKAVSGKQQPFYHRLVGETNAISKGIDDARR